MNASYTKLKSGEWGMKVNGAAKPGDVVTVTKKSGESKRKTVGAIVWSGNGVTLCTIQAGTPVYRTTGKKGYRKSVQAGGGRGDCDDFCYGCSNCM